MKKTETCQNCKSKFVIEPEDFEFYKKIDVPEPTWCPECRLIRRLAVRSIDRLYKDKCDFTGKELISGYNPKTSYKVYDQKIWWSDKWDPMDYGKEYDFKKTFFEQFNRLMKQVPWHNLRLINSVDCEYCTNLIQSKNCYMSHGGIASESCLYLHGPGMTKDSMDSTMIIGGERIYECFDCDNSYRLFFSAFCNNCMDSSFLYDCRNCQSCFGCVNLGNKKYHIFNEAYSKAEYLKEIKKYDLGSYETVQKLIRKFERFNLKFPKPWAKIIKSVGIIGDYVNGSKNCYRCFGVYQGAEDCKFIHMSGLNIKDSYDVNAGGTKSELLYEADFTTSCRNLVCSGNLDNCYDTAYSIECYNCHDIFGCIGLRHKEYCIFNKQYSKQEYKEMIKKIKQQMNDMPYIDKKKRVYQYGDFFPLEMSRFSYHDTPAQVYFPLTKKQALAKGYTWYDRPKPEYKATIKSEKLPDHINDVDKSILKQVIRCQNGSDCDGSGVFQIVSRELDFYKKHNLPLPRTCMYCRRKERSRFRNPLRLWQRQCMNKGCNVKFQTTYSPERKEIVYCQKCYNKEVE